MTEVGFFLQQCLATHFKPLSPLVDPVSRDWVVCYFLPSDPSLCCYKMSIAIISVNPCYTFIFSVSCYRGLGVQGWFAAQCWTSSLTELCLGAAICETVASDVSDIFNFALLVDLNLPKCRRPQVLLGIFMHKLLTGIIVALRGYWGFLLILVAVLGIFLQLLY